LQNLVRPDAEAEEQTAKATLAALQARVDSKLSAVQPKSLPAQPGKASVGAGRAAASRWQRAAASAACSKGRWV
jgi:hypothetical protein